mmetsp:Transcript_58443/g.92383  ORF Transcript_58443/g.92383 Transcript_58443/m.92383 type:complete len:221 (+) Transcript_58443:312-974(+)
MHSSSRSHCSTTGIFWQRFRERPREVLSPSSRATAEDHGRKRHSPIFGLTLRILLVLGKTSRSFSHTCPACQRNRLCKPWKERLSGIYIGTQRILGKCSRLLRFAASSRQRMRHETLSPQQSVLYLQKGSPTGKALPPHRRMESSASYLTALPIQCGIAQHLANSVESVSFSSFAFATLTSSAYKALILYGEQDQNLLQASRKMDICCRIQLQSKQTAAW